MSVFIDPICPDGCDGADINVKYDECAPEIHTGEVTKIYLAKANYAGFTGGKNVENATDWATELQSNIKELTVIGDLPAAEVTEIPISGDRIAIGFKQFTLNFDIDETNDVNYQWLRTLECNMKFRLWFETADGLLYGGPEGISASVRADLVIPRDRNDVTTFTGTAKWRSIFSPGRCKSPMA